MRESKPARTTSSGQDEVYAIARNCNDLRRGEFSSDINPYPGAQRIGHDWLSSDGSPEKSLSMLSLRNTVAARRQVRSGTEQRMPKHQWPLGLAGVVWLATGIGLCLDGLAVTVAPQRPGFGQFLFWVAILIPFVIYTTVLVAANPSRLLRQVTVALVGLYPSIIYRMSSPLVLGGFDEHLHERELLDLLHGSGLFAPNPMLSVGPYYPGLELFTGAVTRLTGMPVMLAMSLVVLLCRLLFVLTIYYSAITVLDSERAASLVVVFYALNPQFYFFNSQFAYQTMALTLGLGGVWLLRRAQFKEGIAARRLSRLGMLALIATVMTHHVTSWLVLGFLVLWAIVSPPHRRKVVVQGAVVMGASIIVWTFAIAGQLGQYLGPVIAAAVQDLVGTVAGTSQGKVFSGVAGYVEPGWQKGVLLIYALCCTCVAITCGSILLLRAVRNQNRPLGLLGLLSLMYPVTLAAHFLPATASLGDRASSFFFLPLALSFSLVFMDPRRPHWLAANRLRTTAFIPFLILISIAYLGAVTIDACPDWAILPGPYLPAAEARSQDPQTLAAVRWAEANIPPGARVAADRIPADLLAAQARLSPVMQPEKGFEPAWLYFSPTWGPYQTAIVKGLHISYIYVDQRLADSLPQVGFYFYTKETPEPQRLTPVDLSKFSRVPGLNVVYHLGPVTIYDTAGLAVAQERDGFTGVRSMGLGAIGDVVLGVLIVLLIFALRRKLRWVASIARDAGVIGSTITLMSVTIILAAVLFGLRYMPGPGFSVAATETAIVCVAVQRQRAHSKLLPSMSFPRHVDPLAVLGFLLAIAGLALSLHAAWSTDVVEVNRLLQSIAVRGGT